MPQFRKPLLILAFVYTLALLHSCTTTKKDPSPSESKGGLTAKAIIDVVKANLDEIKACYERLLLRDPEAKGVIKVVFVIGRKGSVSRAQFEESSILDAEMVDCVLARVRSWQFPKPRGKQPVDVSYPFSFNPG